MSTNAQWSTPESKLPPEHLALRTRLEADKSVVQLTCGLLMPILPGEMYTAEATKQQAENSKLRLAFYRAAKRGKTVKATYTCSTDEGTIARVKSRTFIGKTRGRRISNLDRSTAVRPARLRGL